MRTSRTARVFVLALFLGAFLLSGCRSVGLKSERASSDWSRGELLGKAALNSRVAQAIDGADTGIYAVWITEHELNGPEFLHFAHLDRGGHIVNQGDLPVQTRRPSQVQLVVAQADRLHLAWVDRLGDANQLFYARLDSAGQLLSQPRVLSLPQVSVTDYELGPNPFGGLDVFWSATEGEGVGLYQMQVNRAGETTAEGRNLGRAGFSPAFRFDRDGRQHVVWQEVPSPGEHRLYYATFDQSKRALGNPVLLATFAVTTGLVADRPALGLAAGDVYVFWALERRGGGLTTPRADSYYVVVPIASPELASKPQSVNIPAENQPAYERTGSLFHIGQLASGGEDGLPSEFIYQPTTTQGHQDELAAAFAVQIGYRTKQITHILVTLWADGKMKGYQIASKTRSGSMRPFLLADAQGDLHLIWIDVAGFGSYEVYYAGTSSEARANLNQLTAQDLLAGAFNILWGVVQAVSFFPIIFVWIFVPLVAILAYSFLRVEGDLTRLGPRIMLIVSVVLYIAFKYLFRPSWIVALPLPRNLPSGLSDVLIYITPLLVSGLAGLLTGIYVKRREYASLLPAFGFFVAFDALLTLLIYVPGIVAE